MPPRVRLAALLLFVSGACALAIQTAWLREFRLIFGSSTPATAAVLAIFMGGLGLGNAVLGRRADASASPLRLYAHLELAISALAATSPLLVVAARAIYLSLGGEETLGTLGATFVRLALAALVMGLPAALMGGTLPAAARAVMRDSDSSRGDVGLLYGMNTLGAVLGVVLSTFWLLEGLGTWATLWSAAAVNLANGCVAWWLAGRVQEPGVRGQESRDREKGKEQNPLTTHPLTTHPPQNAIAPWLLYATAGITGFAFFLMELVWYRMLAPLLGGSTFTFGLILAVALAGIGLGGAAYGVIYRDRRPQMGSLALVLACLALALAVPYALGDRLAILASVLRLLAPYGFGALVFGWLLIALIMVFPAALLSGLQFPLLIALLGQGRQRVGTHVGYAFAFNTAGAIAGSLAGGFGLVTLLSAPGVWRLAVLVLVVAALTVLAGELLRIGLRLPHGQALAAIATSVSCLAAVGPTAVWRHSGIGAGRAQVPQGTRNDLRAWAHGVRRNIVWEADGRESSVAISSRRGVGFVINGKNDGNAVTDAGTQIMLGVLGVLLHRQPKDGLVIGLGTGESAGWLAEQPMMERVEVVELEPAIREVAARCAPLNHDVLGHSKVRIVWSDAREVLLTTKRQYDLIASEPSNPYRSGVSSLYTREFYQAVRGQLRDGGILLQWLQGYEIDVPTFRTVLATLCDVFPHVEIWETDPSDLVLVCSPTPLDYTAADIERRMGEPAMARALAVAWRTATREGVLAHRVAGERFTRAVADQRLAALNTDDRNVLEYRFARTVGLAGGLSINGLRAEAAGQTAGEARLGEGVDWEAAIDARIAHYAACGDAPLPSSLFTGERAIRAEALAAFAARGDLPAVARLWSAQPKPPRDLVETLAVASGLAATGNEQALELVKSVQATCPIETEVMKAILASRKSRHGEATRILVGVFKSLQSDATPLPLMVEYALRTALEIAEADQEQLPALYEALRPPLAVLMAQERRITALLLLAQRLGPREMASAMAQTEPYPVWDARLLEMRQIAYDETGHPLSGAARRDLAEFRRHSPEPAVLVGK